MREILFRGKKKDTGEWVEGYYGQFHNRPVVDRENTHQIFEPKENARAFGSAIGGLWHIVIPETVGQFTGLTDVNGKKIFEGDILDTPGWVVTYVGSDEGEDSGMYAGWYQQRDNFESWGELTCNAGGTHHEVIGNIHDNPELMA